MIRFLKTVSTANLTIAILGVIGYAIYGSLAGLPIDNYFLGSRGGYLGTVSGTRIEPWVISLLVETVVVASYILLRYRERNMGGHRLFCAAVVGLGGLWMLFLSMLPHNVDGSLPASFVQLDHFLAGYIWSSHIIYGLIGPNDS